MGAAETQRHAKALRAADDGVHVRGYVSTAWGCPFEGPIAPAAVADVVARIADLGIVDLSIGDTIGVAVPSEIEAVVAPLLESDADVRVALPGGELAIRWDGAGHPLWMAGPAAFAFEGEWTPPA